MKNKNKVFVLSLSTLLLLSCQGESQKSASSEESEPASSLVSSEKENLLRKRLKEMPILAYLKTKLILF